MQREKRNVGPHVGVVKFSIYVHRILPDGSIDPEVINCADLFKDHEISNQAEIYIEGYDKWNCVEKIKQKLEGLKD